MAFRFITVTLAATVSIFCSVLAPVTTTVSRTGDSACFSASRHSPGVVHSITIAQKDTIHPFIMSSLQAASTGQKNPGSIGIIDPGCPLYPQDLTRQTPLFLGGNGFFPQAGLLTFGSFYFPRLPDSNRTSGFLRISSPITAAGPSPNHTGFPFELNPLST